MGKFTINGGLTQVMIDILYPSIPSGNMAVRTMVRYEMGDSSRPRPVVLNESLKRQTLFISIHIYSLIAVGVISLSLYHSVSLRDLVRWGVVENTHSFASSISPICSH